MRFTPDQLAWLAANREKILRYAFLPQLLVALLFLGFAYRTGKDHYHLLLAGTRTQGTIIGFKPVVFRSSSNSFSHTAYMPIIQFLAGDPVVQFQDWKALRSDPGVGSQVPVFYDPSDTSVAMMDRGATNWLPWAPCSAIGLLLALAGLKGLLVFLFVPLRAPAAASRA